MRDKQNPGFPTIFVIILILSHLTAFSDDSVPLKKRPIRADYIPGEIIIKYKENIRKASGTRQYRNGISRIRKFTHTQCEHLKLPDGMSVEEAVEMFAEDPDVLWVEPNYLRRSMAISPPDDTYFSDQWGLNNTGQKVDNTTGTSDADIAALDAWEITTDCSDVIIGVIDTGIDYTHPDLKENVWTNPNESANGVDDDGNGLVDDIHGWNFIGANSSYPGSSNVFDDNGHGTHVSGVIAAAGNNDTGIAGVCWTAKIMALKFLDENGEGSSADEVTAIEYAIDMGVKIINASFGEEGYIQSERDAVDAAGTAGILFIAASGNNGNDNDTSYDYTDTTTGDEANYPASYSLANIISVAASDQNDYLTSFSAYGSQSVDVTAPGTNIYSTYPGSTIIVWEEGFESSTSTSLWTLQDDSWSRTSDQSDGGTYSLYVIPQNVSSSQATAISPGNDVSDVTGVTLDFSVLGNYQSSSETLYVETASSADGPWTNQTLKATQSSGTVVWYDQGITGSDLSSQWTDIQSSFVLDDDISTLYIRFRIQEGATGSSSDSGGGFCFISAARASTAVYAWYIDNIVLQGSDASYSGVTTQYYEFMDGTSSAVPFVSGLAGLIWTQFPDLDFSDIKAAILNGVDTLPRPTDQDKILKKGRINASESLIKASDY